MTEMWNCCALAYDLFICHVSLAMLSSALFMCHRMETRKSSNECQMLLCLFWVIYHCHLERFLPGFQQYVNSNTRGINILDKCYGNISNAYTVKVNPPLANSDHNTVHLIPVYRTLLKSNKPRNKVVRLWSFKKVEILKGFFFMY